MAASSEEALTTVALRTQSDRWQGQSVLVLEPPDRGGLQFWQQDDGAAEVSILSRRWDVARTRTPNAPRAPRFGVAWEGPRGQFETVVAWLPKGKAHQALTWAQAADQVAPGGQLLVVGHNKEGIKSAGRGLKRFFTEVEKLESVRHCAVIRASNPCEDLEDRAAAQAPHRWTLPDALGGFTVVALPGVFSADALDPGTALLLENLPETFGGGRLLDVGCGAGILSVACALRDSRLTLDAVDVDALALESARLTAAASGLEDRVRIAPSDVYRDVVGRYDWILSNPPFHRGQRQDLQLSRRFVEEAPAHLRPHGTLMLVCNRFLPYPTWMDATFGSASMVADDGAYRVWSAHPKPGKRRGERLEEDGELLDGGWEVHVPGGKR